jgi:hypothetical protein
MSLTALLLWKVCRDLPRGYSGRVLAALAPGLVGVAVTGEVYEVAHWLGFSYLLVSSGFIAVAVVTALSGYTRQRRTQRTSA